MIFTDNQSIRIVQNVDLTALREVALDEEGSRGAKGIRPFLDGLLGFYTTDGYVVYKVFDSKDEAAEDAERQQKKGCRSACLVHIRRVFVDAIKESEPEAM